MKKLLIFATFMAQFALPIFAMDRSLQLSHKDMHARITNTPYHADTEILAANTLSSFNYKNQQTEYDWSCGCRAKISNKNIYQLLSAIVLHMQSSSCTYYSKPMTELQLKEEKAKIFDYLKGKYSQK